jgi:hypothetical protein
MAVDAAGRHAMLLEAARTLALVHATSPDGLADGHFAQRGGDGHYLDREIGWTLTELRRTILLPRRMQRRISTATFARRWRRSPAG